MNEPSRPLRLRFLRSLADLNASTWNSLAGPDYPFLRHEFLLALENSGCTTSQTGWQPYHLLLETIEGETVGCLPLYLKGNSMGEYVFDWSWADAYARHGLDYYPKLLSAIPFTPCAGPRLCLDPAIKLHDAVPQVVAGLRAKAMELGISGWHLLFPDLAQKEAFSGSSLLLRTGCQYQWFNDDYGNFDDFLASMNSRKRKNLRKERARVAEQGIEFEQLEGRAITPEHWHVFFGFYRNTYYVRGRRPYLNEDFFQDLGRTMPDSLLLVLARRSSTCVAGALYFKGSDTLYGRYWGSSADHQFLHFETCYYQGIDYCIRHGIKRIDSGAQGEHKIQRGFRPVPTWSLHWIADPRFRDAIAHFIDEENVYVNQYLTQASEYLPFRKDLELPRAHGRD